MSEQQNAFSAVLLIPTDISESMIVSGTTVPVVDSSVGEVAWDVDEDVTTGMRRNHNGSIWEALKNSKGVTPGSDPTAWLRVGPSNRMAALDDQLDTVTRREGNITYVIEPGFFTGIGMWGIVGEQLEIEIYDEPDGDLVESFSLELWEQAAGLYELLFMPLKRRTQFHLEKLPLYPHPQVKISITAANNALCEVALITIGHWDTLIGSSDWGGVQYEAEADIKSYSYLKRNDDGSVTRKRRGSATNVHCSVILSADEANHAADLLHTVQGRPVMFIASGMPKYEYLNGFGDVSGAVSPLGPNHARVNLKIEGAVQGARN